MSNDKIICPVCGTEFEGESFVEECPYCDWVLDYSESEEEYSSTNYTTIKYAKENVAKGLNIWGEPLPKK